MAQTFQRARQPAQKEQRRNAILAAAADLLADVGYDAVSLTAIADRAGLSKSNLYRYFESREEILLALLADDVVGLTEEVEEELAPFAGTGDREAVVRVLVAAWVERQRLCQLVSVLSSVLERNLTERPVVDFKLRVLGLNRRIVNALHAALPGLPVERCATFLRLGGALAAGLWPLANPSSVVARVQARPELAGTEYVFARELARGFEALLAGLQDDTSASR